jgi:hypothetical protein
VRAPWGVAGPKTSIGRHEAARQPVGRALPVRAGMGWSVRIHKRRWRHGQGDEPRSGRKCLGRGQQQVARLTDLHGRDLAQARKRVDAQPARAPSRPPPRASHARAAVHRSARRARRGRPARRTTDARGAGSLVRGRRGGLQFGMRTRSECPRT